MTVLLSNTLFSHDAKDSKYGFMAVFIGPCRRIRTSDPLLPKQMRYQAALYTENLAELRGIEPAIYGVKGRCPYL